MTSFKPASAGVHRSSLGDAAAWCRGWEYVTSSSQSFALR